MKAMMQVETGGDCLKAGSTGELATCLQYTAPTWSSHSVAVLGEEVKPNKTNELYVALKMIDRKLEQGYSESDVVLEWNQGHLGPCSSGINAKFNMPYDSCNHVRKVMALLK